MRLASAKAAILKGGGIFSTKKIGGEFLSLITPRVN